MINAFAFTHGSLCVLKGEYICLPQTMQQIPKGTRAYLPNRYNTFYNQVGAMVRRAEAPADPATADDPGPSAPTRPQGLLRRLVDLADHLPYDNDATPDADWDRKTSESPTSEIDS